MGAVREAVSCYLTGLVTGSEREFFIDNLMVRIHLIVEIILVERPCAMEFVFFLLSGSPISAFPSHTSPASRLGSALETTLGQMAPPKSVRVQECHLIQLAF